ncbi:gluconate 2-dehydrogenase subunit 3 family protein [Pontibacillus salicampi]|uniref:Gluconate 2-dehydrogenase subunit 3 family protein n=1 Tax=Pontibacillus salicampi TaxID=1449801 RepID=A0ABV6LLY1_9BACI
MESNHPRKSYYPTYDVLSNKQSWDQVTRNIIEQRMHGAEGTFFTPDQKRTLVAIAKALFPSHVGEQSVSVSIVLDRRMLEGKLSIYPKQSSISKEVIIDQGLILADKDCLYRYHQPFFMLEEQSKHELLEEWRQNDGNPEVWMPVKSDLFFSTLASELVKIVYSDPGVWSTIGFGGPAYPRGYYAYGPKQFDSWEAKPHDENAL